MGVALDGVPVLDAQRHEIVVRTGATTAATVGLSIQRTPMGLQGVWDTQLPLLRGEIFDIWRSDVSALDVPATSPVRRVGNDLQHDMVPRLLFYSGKHASGLMSELIDGTSALPGEHVLTLFTPRSNVVALERRGGLRVVGGAAALTFGLIFTAVALGIAPYSSSHDRARIGLATTFGAVGGGLDVIGIYHLVRARAKKLPLP